MKKDIPKKIALQIQFNKEIKYQAFETSDLENFLTSDSEIFLVKE